MSERVWDFLLNEFLPFLATSSLVREEITEILYYICKGFQEKEVK